MKSTWDLNLKCFYEPTFSPTLRYFFFFAFVLTLLQFHACNHILSEIFLTLHTAKFIQLLVGFKMYRIVIIQKFQIGQATRQMYH